MVNYSLEDLSVGMSCNRSYVFTEEAVESFARLVDDMAPVHIDNEFAIKSGFKGKIVHGLFVQSIFSGMLGTELPGPKTVINNISMKMHKPVLVGEKVDYKIEITAITAAVSAVSLNFSGSIGGEVAISGKALCSFTRSGTA